MRKLLKGQLRVNHDGRLCLCGYELQPKSKIKLQLNDKWVTVIICYTLGREPQHKAYARNLEGLSLDGRMAKARVKI